MSEYHVCSISLEETQSLIDALIEMGYKPQVSDKPKNLVGYQGDKRKQKAHIIIPRSQITKASNDIGFEKVGKKYIMHVSQYDESIKSFDVGKLKQLYTKHRLNSVVARKSSKYKIKNQSVDKKGVIQIVIKRI